MSSSPPKVKAPRVARVSNAGVVKPKTKKEKKAERKAIKEAKIASGQDAPKRTTGGLHKPMRLSPRLAELLGMREASRSEVRKRVSHIVIPSNIL